VVELLKLAIVLLNPVSVNFLEGLARGQSFRNQSIRTFRLLFGSQSTAFRPHVVENSVGLSTYFGRALSLDSRKMVS